MGYHKKEITKGVLGKPSKIREELEELEDALDQGNRIMAMLELADIYGALEAVAESLGTNMPEVKLMAKATKSAFEDGSRVTQPPRLGASIDLSQGSVEIVGKLRA